MNLFHRKTPAELAAEADQRRQQEEVRQLDRDRRAEEQARKAEDQVRISQGGIPIEAERRLHELSAAKPGDLSFTSDLSPDEAGLLRRRGYRVLGLVTGSAVYHVGIAYASSYRDVEVQELSGAYNEATRLAVGRMEQEAVLLKAHGVVGVRYDMVRHEWANKTIEVQLIGTAVVGHGPAPKEPWLSDLSGQEWWSLTRAGFEPAGLVWGHCTWFVLTQATDEWTERSWTNQELTHFSQALHQCRDRAVRHLHEQARQRHADGVMGVHIARKLEEIRLSGPGENPAYEREHHNLTLSLIGTAIRERPDAPRQVRGTVNVLSLRDGRLVPVQRQPADATFE